MKIEATTPEQYIEQLPSERKEAISKLREVIFENLPEGFTEEMSYGMIGYVVPKSIYTGGYHANPELPLPFINIASQKNHIAVYHSGIYADKNLMDWFVREFPKHSSKKLDMGKSCLRFKKPEDIPFELIGQLAGKMTVDEWIKISRQNIKRKT
jgi:uncharacterized protein YdhG (YjbR/CyaY superfamily)